MAEISYFQRFSQRENHVTNNTMLLLKHVYSLGPLRLARVLSTLMDIGVDDLNLGPTFRQQVRANHSVPDAAILQPALEIWVETKLGDDLGDDQIRAHLAHAGKTDRPLGARFLVGLTRQPISAARLAHFQGLAHEAKVNFVATTFDQIVEAVRGELRPHETETSAILDDYVAFLGGEDLLLTDDRTLAIFPCGTSEAENVEFGMYYEPASRPRKRSVFVGVYARKAVRHIGRVEAVIIADPVDGEMVFSAEVGQLTSARTAQVQAMIAATPYYDLKDQTTRFYVTSGMQPTCIEKTTPNGIMGFRYLNIAEREPNTDLRKVDVAALAERARSWTFE